MKLNTSVICAEMGKHYNIVMSSSDRNTSICSFRVYDGTEFQPNVLYVISREDLAFIEQNEPDAVFLCAGIDKQWIPELLQDVIYIKEPVGFSELANRLLEIFDYYNQWEASLHQKTRDMRGIFEMLNQSGKVLEGTIILADDQFNYLAYTSDFESTVRLYNRQYPNRKPDFIVEDILTDPAYFNVQISREVTLYQVHVENEIQPALCYNLFLPGKQYYAYRLILTGSETFTRKQYFLLKFLGDLIEPVISGIAIYSLPVSGYNSLHTVIRQCLQKKPAAEALIVSILRSVSWEPEASYILIRFVPYFLADKSEINELLCNNLELLFSHSCAVVYDNSIVLLCNTSKGDVSKTLTEKLSIFLRESLYKAGIGNEFQNFFALREAYNEATAALQIGTVKDSMFWFYRFDMYTIEYMIAKSTEDIPRENLCSKPFLALWNYDRTHGTQLLHLLKTYILLHFNVTTTAGELYLHRTTVLKHLKKVEEISRINLDEWNDVLHFILSCRIMGQL